MNEVLENRKRGRLDHIDGLRALAALYVVMHHILLYVNDELPKARVMSFPGIFIYGHYAVDVFIVLSGFCLMLPVIRNQGKISGGALHFFRKRALRILPPYYFAVAASLALIWCLIGTPHGTPWNSSLPVTSTDLMSHLFLFQDAFSVTTHRIDYPLWSISVEWRIYFLFPFMVWCWNRFGALRTVAATAIVSYFLLIPLQYTFLNTSAGGVSLHYYALFSFGMLAAAFGYSDEKPLARLRARIPWAALFVAMAGITLVGNKGYCFGCRLPWQFQDLFVGLAALALLIAVTPGEESDRWHWVRNALSWTPLVFVGSFSYSLYLIHAPLLEVIWVYFVHPLQLSSINSYLVLSSAGVAVVIAVSYLFFLVCERPFIRIGKGRPRAAAAVTQPEVIEETGITLEAADGSAALVP